MRGILTLTMVATVLAFCVEGLWLRARADTGQTISSTVRPAPKKTEQSARAKELAAAYQVHTFRRRTIATRLNELWAQEHEINQQREQSGRAGNIFVVKRLERDLLGVRKEIDSMRAELTRENRMILLIDNQISGKQ